MTQGNPPVVGGPPGRWSGRTFRVAGAGNDVREALLTTLWQPFAEATGCRLEVGITDYGALSGGNPGRTVDLALVEERWAILLGDAGQLVAVDAIGTDGTFPDLVGQTPFSVPAYADAIVSAARVDGVPTAGMPPDWVAWWDSKSFPGGRTMEKGPYGTFEFSLISDGVAIPDLYPLDLERALARLRRISGSIVDRWWETAPQSIEWLSGGRASLGTASARQVASAQRSGRPLQVNWNQGLLYSDHWAIPVGAEGEDIARDFISWALTVPAQAALASSAMLAPVSSRVFAGLDALLVRQLATGPDNLPRLVRSDARWWAGNWAPASEAFNRWLLGDPRGF
jgi:putative spermidine/putrescine transport system substrate-binding protein